MGGALALTLNLAIKDINDSGGVLGSKITVEHAYSCDGDHAEVATQSVTDLISAKVQIIIRAVSSKVTLNVTDDVTAAKIVQISGANTATKLSGYSPFYFRTARPDDQAGRGRDHRLRPDEADRPRPRGRWLRRIEALPGRRQHVELLEGLPGGHVQWRAADGRCDDPEAHGVGLRRERGDECKSFKDCVASLTAGKAIQYKGQAGVGPFDAKNDPSSACRGVYEYQDDNS